jgi:NADH-quinone oxidoreductase subunit L
MGGLWKENRWLGIWFLTGCLAISGVPPFAGFFSKDEILAATYVSGHKGLFAVAVLAAFFTAFYMFRLFFLVFAGENRSGHKAEKVPGVMAVPVAVLALLSLVSGFVNAPVHALDRWLAAGSRLVPAGESGPVWIPVVAALISLLGIGLAYLMYVAKQLAPERVAGAVPWLHRVVFRKYYVDEFYRFFVVWPLKGLGWFLQGFDRFVIGGLVALSAWIFSAVGRLGSRVQNGQAQTYALISLLGFVLLLVGLTARRLWE